jgi:hypothetical protein
LLFSRAQREAIVFSFDEKASTSVNTRKRKRVNQLGKKDEKKIDKRGRACDVLTGLCVCTAG